MQDNVGRRYMDSQVEDYRVCYRSKLPLFLTLRRRKKIASLWCSGRVCEGPMACSKRQKTARCKGLYGSSGEVENSRILANRAKIRLILHANRNRAFYGFFPVDR